MDNFSLVMIVAAFCVLGLLSGFFRSSDKRAAGMEHRNPDVAKALRDPQRHTNQSDGPMSP